MSPPPDNIYLVTDGLPTLGKNGRPSGTTISGKQRVELFHDASKHFPPKVPINVIMFPLEGDPIASAAYWDLAQSTTRRLPRTVEGLAMKPRRPVEEMSMSFLDVICCGFGAVILLLMTTKFIPPTVLEQSSTHLDGTVAARQEALFQIRGRNRQS